MEHQQARPRVGRGLPSTMHATAAGLYVETFDHKLAAVLGAARHELIERCLDPRPVLVAVDHGQLVGLAGLALDARRFVNAEQADFLDLYGPVVGRLRHRLWASTRTHPRTNQILLDVLAVDHRHRGQGIGTQLLEHVDRYAAEHAKTEIILEVIDVNPDAKRLYERTGFETVHTTRNPLFRLAGFNSADLMLRSVSA